MNNWREFRPQQNLLNPKFDGYRLTLDPLAQYRLKLDDNIIVQKEFQLDNEFYTYNFIKGFKSLNQLHMNPWKSDNDLYFVDQMHSIQKISVPANESLSHLQQPVCVYRLGKNTLHASMIFLSETLVSVCDGRSRLLLLNMNNPKWQPLYEQDLDEFVSSPIRLLHGVYHEQVIHVLIGFVKTECELLWLSFSTDSSNQVKLIRRRILCGKKWPDVTTIESNGLGLYVASEGSYKFTFDSLFEIKPEEIPKPLVVEKIESVFNYVWSQTHNTIEIEIDSKSNEALQWSVTIDSDYVKCSLNDQILFDARLFDNVDSKDSSYSIKTEPTNCLMITLQKSNIGSFWNEVFKEGKTISGDIKMVNIPETNNTNDDDERNQPYNSQQIEECDQYSNENDTYLFRFDGDKHTITHQALICNQILFTKLNPPLICIRHDVDGLIWKINSLQSDDQSPWSHEATLNAFGYVQASKQNRKFISVPNDFSYAIISDMTTHLYLYKQQNPISNLSGTSLRNRKTGKFVESIAKQHMISLENHTEILGLVTTNELIYILTTNELFIISI